MREELHHHILSFFNAILEKREIPEEWMSTFFILLPKSGDLQQVQNWRPIAILIIMYKIFARMVFNRIKDPINQRLSLDQCAYRPTFCIEDCLFVIDTLLSKTSEFNLPVWAASLDMRKAFDRVEHKAVVEALHHFGIDAGTIALIQLIYVDQTGTMDGYQYFDISRGVRQGDVLSTLLFNAVLDVAFARWKNQLDTHGWKLDESGTSLTNLCFADDALILAKSQSELCSMLKLLFIELRRIGLEINRNKSKILTTQDGFFRDGISRIMWINHECFHLIGIHEWHKYLGRHLSFSYKQRACMEIKHRIAAA